MTFFHGGRATLRLLAAGGLALALSGCAGGGFFGRDGPSSGAITRSAKDGKAAVLLKVDEKLATQLTKASRRKGFSDTFGKGQPYGAIIGPGDFLQISVFEAPPALLFGANSMSSVAGVGSGVGQRGITLPDVQVDASGQIDVPFAGKINVAGASPQQVARQIVTRLRGRANEPQAVVNISRNIASSVTVVGEVPNSTRMPLTFKGERLLDALAAAGGSREPVDKVSIQLAREGTSTSVPLDELIARPEENVFLRPGDVVTVSYKPESFTVLGASGRNEEINFEARGITLAQALGRIGGLKDDRANPSGVFIFRLQDPRELTGVVDDASLGGFAGEAAKVPVIFQIDLRNPITFFAAQRFAIRDRDVLFVSNAPATDLQKFVNVIGAAIYPIVTVKAAGL